ncbi:hypothetical protein DKM44_03320 [Deinococcus irradiatisoli]|uniref:DUF11 domain-containing protein n=2 Tax=Deinococcus irradiatisoli TaxID=2202254 RepID=A0A2Z3JBG8_9DEIO|nr:hypothetical protein DKM44_03320 [Deinococcus irradiatisoli]
MYIKLLQSDTFIYTIQLPTSTGGSLGAQGKLTLSTSVPMADMAFDPVTNHLYGVYTAGTPATDGATAQGVIYDIDPTTGTVITRGTAFANPATGNYIGSSFFDIAGTLYAYQNGGTFGTIDLSTGTFTRITSASAASQSDGASCVFPDEKISVSKSANSVQVVSPTVFKVPYTVTVTNTGSIPDRNVQLTENLSQTFNSGSPALSIVAGPTATSSVTSNTVTPNSSFNGTTNFSLLSGTNILAVGETITVTFTVQVTYPNTASVPGAATSNIVRASSTSTSPNDGYTFLNGAALPPVDMVATSTSLPAAASLVAQATITKAFSPASVVLNGVSTLTFTLANPNSSVALTNLNFTDALSGMSVSSTIIGGTCGSTTNNPALTVGATALNLTVPSLAANSSCTVTLPVNGTSIGVNPNTTSGVTSTQTPTAGSASNTATLTVTPLAPVVNKSFSPASVLQGGSTQLTINVSNPNGVAATGLTLTDDIATTTGLTGLTISSVSSDTCKATGTVTTTSGKYVLTGGTLPSAGCTVVLNLTLPNAGVTGSVTNTILGSSVTGTINGQSLPTVTNATATLNVQPVADLAITKTDGVGSVSTGASTTYTIRVTNNGPSSVTSSVLTDPSATGLTQTAAACTTVSGNACTVAPTLGALQGTGATLPALATGAFYEINVTASVTAASGSVTNTATIAAPSGVNDPVTTNNTASDTDSVAPLNFSISGRVFVDTNYGGGAGRAYIAAQGMGLRPGVRVELYNSAGTFISAVLTDASGAYSFTNQVAGSYKVRVVNTFVTAARTGGCTPSTVLATAPTCTQVPVQTYIYGNTAQVGGANPASVDPALSSTTLPTGAQSVASVTLSSTDVTGVDFGFNFDTVVNTNDSGQGSLRQFVTNSNALGNTGLAQVGQTAGKEVSIFMVPVTALTNNVAVINLSSTLTVTDSDTSIDATTQTVNIGDKNTGVLGTGGSVGVDGLTLNTVNRPEVELTLPSGSALQVQASNFVLRGVALHGGNELVLGVGANAADNALVEQNVFGTSATAFSLPASFPSGQYAIHITNGSGTIQNNLIGYSSNSGINYLGGGAGLIIQNNEFQQNGYVQAGGDAITLTGSASAKSLTITGNLIANSNSSGIQLEIGSVANNTITNNSITSNGLGGASTRLEGSGIHYLARNGTVNSTNSDTVSKNVIYGNQKSGLVINYGQQNVTISRNSFYSNGLTSIDFTAVGAYVGGTSDYGQGNGVTPNDGLTGTREPNQGQDYPVFYTAYQSGTSLIVSGYVGNNLTTTFDGKSAILELYKADDDGNQNGAVLVGDGKSIAHGEGRTYLGTLTVTLGAKGAFSGALTVAANTLLSTDKLTATATIAGNTSEFSPNIYAVPVAAPELLKRVRNVTAGGTFGTLATGKPGDVLEYCITFNNIGSNVPLNNFKVVDQVPANVSALTGAYGGSGLGAAGISFLRGGTAAAGTTAVTGGTTITLTSVADSDQGSLTTSNGTYGRGTLNLQFASALALGEAGQVCFQATIR